MPKIISLIPCYNAANYCEPVIRETLLYSDKLILVNDGSTDSTEALLKKLAKSSPEKITLISYEKNLGKGSALLLGMKEAIQGSFDALVTLDADQQHLPKEIPLLASSILKGSDFAIGIRELRKMPFRSKFSNLFISKLLRLFYPQAPIDTQSGFRSFDPSFAKKITEKVSGGRYEMEFRCLLLALKENLKIDSVPITTLYFSNHSSYFKRFSDSIRILKVLYNHWRKKAL